MTPLDNLAARQLRDYDACSPGAQFANGVQLSVEDAYALQHAVAELRRQRGEQHIGYKVGCTSPAIRAQLGVDHPVAGHLWDSERKHSDCTLRLDDYFHPAVEGELAVELIADLTDDRAGESEIVSAIGSVFPVIEMHNAAFRSGQPCAAELIANNALHAGFVAGESRACFQQPASASLSIQFNGEIVDEYDGPELSAGIIRSLGWLRAHLATYGRSLRAGEIVLTGSLPKLIPVNVDTRIHVETSNFGSVAARCKR